MDLAKKRQLGVVAVVAVALVGGGAALAASKLHRHASANPSFAGPGGLGGRGYGHPEGGLRSGFRARGPGDDLAAAADYLGISTSTLQADLQSGKTLAQIASSIGDKSSAGLIDALVAREQSTLAAAVSSGRLSQAQSDRISANLRARVTALVNGTFDERGFGGPPYGGMPGHAPGQGRI
jgi:hypothetical protein